MANLGVNLHTAIGTYEDALEDVRGKGASVVRADTHWGLLQPNAPNGNNDDFFNEDSLLLNNGDYADYLNSRGFDIASMDAHYAMIFAGLDPNGDQDVSVIFNFGNLPDSLSGPKTGFVSPNDDYTSWIPKDLEAAGQTLYDFIIYGYRGDGELFGQAGNDILRGDEGADLIDGGVGRDRATYTSSSTGLTISLDDSTQNTGESAGDTYVSIEDLQGSKHADIIVGDIGSNRLWGYHGNDEIYAGSGNDYVYGQNGNDELFGEADNDWLEGSKGNDFLMGGAGADRFVYRGSDLGDDIIGDFEINSDHVRFYSRSIIVL